MDVAASTQVHYRNNLGRFISDCESGARGTIAETVKEGARLSKGFAPERDGGLKRSIEPVVISRTSGVWRATAPHALPQEFGARPHEISGSPGLSFFWEKEGRMFTPAPGGKVTTVNHPGNPAHPYLRPAYKVVMGRVMSIAKRHYPG